MEPKLVLNLKNDPSVYEWALPVRMSEVDPEGRMTLPAIINAYQDVSTFHSEEHGLGGAYLAGQGRAWVLTHWDIVVDRYPKMSEQIVAGTFATRFHGFVGERTFYLRGTTGELLSRATSTWGFLDLGTGHLAKVDPAFTDPYGTREGLPMPAGPRKIALPAETERTCELRVRRHHLDPNGHMNNAQYVLIALDELDPTVRPHRIRVDYRHSAMLGNIILASVAHEDGRYVVLLENDEGRLYATVEFSQLGV